jgi:hypothetical protein
MYVQIDLATDCNIRVPAVEVREEVEGEDDRAIGGILKWCNAGRCGAVLNGCEDVFNRRLWDELVLLV